MLAFTIPSWLDQGFMLEFLTYLCIVAGVVVATIIGLYVSLPASFDDHVRDELKDDDE